MQLFGLVSLLITIAAISWWITSTGPLHTAATDEGAEEAGYQEAVSAAEDLVGQIEMRDAKIPSSTPEKNE